jgi:hypothetical protein
LIFIPFSVLFVKEEIRLDFFVGGVVRSSSDGRCSALNHRRRVSEKRKQRGAPAFPFVSFFFMTNRESSLGE